MVSAACAGIPVRTVSVAAAVAVPAAVVTSVEEDGIVVPFTLVVFASAAGRSTAAMPDDEITCEAFSCST
jgi:hypothetical protein